MKFILFVEGDTERDSISRFVRCWLNERLETKVGVKVVKFTGWAELVKESAKKARMYLDGPERDDVISVIGLLDLYGPGICATGSSIEERQKKGREEIEKRVDHPDFRQYFAVHEVEAWLLSDPGVFPRPVRDLLEPHAKDPEAVDLDEPPSHLLNRLYLRQTHRGYKKTVDGKDLFAKLNPNIAYKKCPYLRQMLDDLLLRAKAAGLS